MSIRTILVPIDGSESSGAALDLAFDIGRLFKAHVDVLFVKPDPKNAVPMLGEGMSGTMIEEMLEQAERDAAAQAAQAHAQFEGRTTAAGVPVVDSPPGPDDLSASWREQVGREDEVVGVWGRVRDLSVVARPLGEQTASADQTFNAALYETGKPVLVAPPKVPAELGNRVVVAWNGSAQATRAVSAAMPFLHRAQSVTLLVGETDEDGDTRVEELASHLSWHGIAATPHKFSPDGASVAEALMAECDTIGCDLLVMGAYTHSRMWEVILGGVTRHVLETAELPVLMAH